jgi:hypothetical protein
MPDATGVVIAPEERGLAAITHLSGLAGYIIPLGGVLVPIIIWLTKQDSPIISAIAKQAILLNVAAFVLVLVCVALVLTLVGIPVAILLGICIGIGAVALPIVGAVKASSGIFYQYPVVGSRP